MPSVRSSDAELPSPAAATPSQLSLRGASYVHLFPIPMMFHHWPDARQLNEALRDRILETARRERGEKRTNVGGWHSASGQLEFLGDLRSALLDRMYAMANEATSRLAGDCQLPSITVRWSFVAWANVSGDGDFHATHNHPGATWSGVYYVETGSDSETSSGGELRLIDPCQGRASSFFPFVAQNATEIKPRPGLMVLFPSYLPHAVHPYRGNGSRISIAFNFRKEPFP